MIKLLISLSLFLISCCLLSATADLHFKSGKVGNVDIISINDNVIRYKSKKKIKKISITKVKQIFFLDYKKNSKKSKSSTKKKPLVKSEINFAKLDEMSAIERSAWCSDQKGEIFNTKAYFQYRSKKGKKYIIHASTYDPIKNNMTDIFITTSDKSVIELKRGEIIHIKGIISSLYVLYKMNSDNSLFFQNKKRVSVIIKRNIIINLK